MRKYKAKVKALTNLTLQEADVIIRLVISKAKINLFGGH